MKSEPLRVGGVSCVVYRTERPRVLLLQPVDRRELAALEREAETVAQATGTAFALCDFCVEDWDRELSPWAAPEFYAGRPFGGGAGQTLAFVERELLPSLRARYGPAPVLLGGYSLAGLFALWCGYETDLFAGVMAASPSVWFDGWTDYAAQRTMKARTVYLSLGDREEKARDPRLARVGDCIRRQKALLDASAVANTLVWEPGSHFQQPDMRTARGFAWLIMEQDG